jgi:hypothetical protein
MLNFIMVSVVMLNVVAPLQTACSLLCSSISSSLLAVPQFFQVDAEKIQENTFLFSQMEVYPLPFKPYIDDFNSQPFVPKDPWDLVSILFNFFLRHLHPEACTIKIF